MATSKPAFTNKLPRLALAVLALTATLATVTAAGNDTRSLVVRQRVHAILEGARTAPASRTASAPDPARKLAGLGGPAIPVMFESIRTGRMPLATKAGGDLPPRLSDGQRVILMDAMGRLRRKRVRPFLQRQLIIDGGRRTRVAVLRVLGEIGISADLEYAVGVAAPGGRLQTGTVRQSLTNAITRILHRDPASFRVAERVLFASRPTAAGAFIRALGSTGGTEELATLARLLDRSSEHDTVVLASVGQIGQRLLRPLDPAILTRVRQFLEAENPQLVREAALASGKLEDFEAVERLADCLGHEDESVRLVALWALRKITGVSYAVDPAPWKQWVQAEIEWFENEAPPLIEILEEANDAAQIGAALNQLSVRRYRRDELAAAIATVLEHDSPTVRSLGCQALKQLGSTAGVLPLIEALEDHDEGVAGHAFVALQALTGRDLAQDFLVWQGAYDSNQRPAALVARR